LGKWVFMQRRSFKSNSLLKHRIEKLNKIGFVWEFNKEDTWMSHYDELVEYKREFGDCCVPRYSKANLKLAGWVSRQRTLFKMKSLSEDRIAKLNELGFTWEVLTNLPPRKDWMSRYNDLVEYKRKFGDCCVKKSKDRTLASWVVRQRRLFKSNSLTEDCIAQLNELGFTWEVDNEAWMTHYNNLVEYKREFGDCYVPSVYRPNPSLGHWVANQRAFYKNKSLAKDRVAKLNKIGFGWAKKSR